MPRSLIFIFVLLGMAPAAMGATQTALNQKPTVVTILGDSITAGLGLPEAEAAPAQLQGALKAQGVAAEVRGAGVSGDTSAGGLARVDFSVLPDTRICVIELGANDYLQSVDPQQVRANLTAIIRKLKARHITVVLAASTAPRLSSGGYGRAFDSIFPSIAKQEHVAIAGNLLVGVEDKIALKQADGLHPNAAGVKIIASRLARVVARVIRTGH